MNYSEMSCAEFTERLASKMAVPGGGGASALAGALAASLASMTANLTVGKKKYASVEKEMEDTVEKCRILQTKFLELITKDAEAFESLSKAYALPKTTESERQEQSSILEPALKEACMVPLEIMETCAETIQLLKTVAEKGSVLAISDAGSGALLGKAAMQSASLNVYINTKSMKDRVQAADLNKKADCLLEKYGPLADEIYTYVISGLKKTR